MTRFGIYEPTEEKMRKITCNCEHEFSADLPDEVNLDRSPDILEKIADGSFLSCACPSCGAILHTDLETRVEWPSREMRLLLVPELARLSVLSGHLSGPEGFDVVVGYAELADRVAVYAARLDALAVETLKFHLAEKALDSVPDSKPLLTFESLDGEGNLLFHIHGLRDSEVAVSSVPLRLYESVRNAVGSNPGEEPQSLLRNGAYLSVQNVLFEGGQDD